MATIRTSDSQSIYDLKYPGAAIDTILDTAYDLQNAGYIFRGLASEYSNTPTERSWVLAGEGETGHGFTSPVPKGYIGVCVFNGTSWTGKLLKCVSIDSAPTPGSTNAVSSGGAYAALNQLATGVAEALDNMAFTDVTPPADQYNQLKLKLATTDSGIERIITYLTFLSATTSKAGLLSAADKAKLDAILGNLRSLEIDDTTAYADLGDKIVESIKATIGGTEETISTFQILAATTSKAGLLSAADKTKLDALWSSGYQFAGIATPSTTPISTTSKIFYIATEAGTYFNAVTVTQGINILSWDGSAWSAVQVIGIDDVPTAGSSNLIYSSGVYNSLYNKVEATINGYIDAETGNIVTNNSWLVSDFFFVYEGMNLEIYSRIGDENPIVAYYDINGNYLSSLTPYDSEAIIYQFKVRTETVPAGAYKARYHSAIDAEKEPYAICIDNKGEAEDILWKNIVQVYNLLYSKIGATIDGYINSCTGKIVANNYWKTSEPFFVYEDMTLEVYNKISDENPILAYYDKDGNYLSALTPYDAEAVSTEFKARVLTVPAGAYMARYHSANDANDTPFALCLDNKGKTLGELWQTLSSKTDGFDRQLTIIPTHSGYINKNTGEVVPTNSWKHSGMFPVSPGSVYTLYSRTSSAVTLIAYYDSDGRYLKDLSPVSQSEGSQYETNNVTIPEGASYAMFHSSSDTDKTPTCKLKDGSILENAYQTGYSAVLEKYDFRTTLKAPLVLTGDIDMVFFGDSITYGVASTEPTEENPYGLITPCENPYAKVLCSNLNIPYRSWNNKAVSGSRFAGTWDGINSITSKILAFSSSADIIYIAGGTNDYATGSTIGIPTDDTEDTLYGALNLICAYLKANYSSSTVIFALPINMSKSQDNSVPLNQYREVIYEVAVSNGFYVVDCSEIGFPQKITANGTPEFKKTMIYDGIHPTEHGHKVMGDVLSYILNGCRV